jgi:hypothetical protein
MMWAIVVLLGGCFFALYGILDAIRALHRTIVRIKHGEFVREP